MENKELQTFSRNAEFKAGLNNKFYEVEATERPDGRAVWTFRWGRIGTKGQSKTGVGPSFASAKATCNAQFQTKLDKGYVEISAMQVLASACQTVEERPVNGLPPVDLEIPIFGAGPSETRCREFVQKYVDKMNVVRKSKDDLGTTAYVEQQVSLIESFVEEWDRMCASKTHGVNLLGQQARDAYKKTLTLLREFGLYSKESV